MSAQSQHVDVRFQEWLRAAGAETTKLRWPVEFPVTGRGVAVTEVCKKGDVLCRLPSAVMLTVDRALAALSPWWPAALSQHTDNDELLLACYILAAAGADVSSSHAPSMENLRRLVPYVHVLPPASDFDAIATEWTSAELGLLADAQAAQATLAAQIRLAQEFADVACALSKAAVDDAVPQALARVFDWANYRWARYCVRSRAFINGLGMDPLFMCMDTVDMLPIAMVPLGDMLNHTAGAPNAEADWVAEASPPAHAGAEATGWYNLIARASIAAGTEVCISYGDRSSRDMIENYGFCIPPAANPAESLSVDMLPVYAHACTAATTAATTASFALEALVPRSAGLARCRDALLDALGRPTSLEFTAAEQPSTDVLLVCRILCCGEDDMRAIAAQPDIRAGIVSSSAATPCTVDLCALTRAQSRALRPERFDKPLSRNSELRVLGLIRWLVTRSLQELVDGARSWTLPTQVVHRMCIPPLPASSCVSSTQSEDLSSMSLSDLCTWMHAAVSASEAAQPAVADAARTRVVTTAPVSAEATSWSPMPSGIPAPSAASAQCAAAVEMLDTLGSAAHALKDMDEEECTAHVMQMPAAPCAAANATIAASTTQVLHRFYDALACAGARTTAPSTIRPQPAYFASLCRLGRLVICRQVLAYVAEMTAVATTGATPAATA